MPASKKIESPAEEQPTIGELLRAFWLFLGNAGLFFAAGTIGNQPPWTMTKADVVFGGLVIGMLVARYLDIAHFSGKTAEGEPATMRHLASYAARLVVVTGGLWTLAQSVQI